MNFKVVSNFKPTGDQPQAIEQLTSGLQNNKKFQVLLGVTGSGKTFSIANVIKNVQRPTLVISHNKTLAAQLYQELRDFFPENAVSYFVSYYDYYQPEAYVPTTDTYIAKETEINDEIDKLRLAATTNILTRNDTIVVASVSCIYNIGSPLEFGKFAFEIKKGVKLSRKSILDRLLDLMIAFEALFLNDIGGQDRGEMRFRLSLRVAYFLREGRERKTIFNEMREAYNIRSSIVHGDEYDLPRVEGRAVPLNQFVARIEGYLRESLRKFVELAQQQGGLPPKLVNWDDILFTENL